MPPAHNRATAIARSSPEPVFLTSAFARSSTYVATGQYSNPDASSAERHAHSALTDRGVAEPDDVHARQALAKECLHLDGDGFDTRERCGMDRGQHIGLYCRPRSGSHRALRSRGWPMILADLPWPVGDRRFSYNLAGGGYFAPRRATVSTFGSKKLPRPLSPEGPRRASGGRIRLIRRRTSRLC